MSTTVPVLPQKSGGVTFNIEGGGGGGGGMSKLLPLLLLGGLVLLFIFNPGFITNIFDQVFGIVGSLYDSTVGVVVGGIGDAGNAVGDLFGF